MAPDRAIGTPQSSAYERDSPSHEPRSVESLIRATEDGSAKSVQSHLDLLQTGPDVKDLQGVRLLLKAAHRGYLDVVELLHKLGADLHIRDRRGNSALHAAAQEVDHQFYKNRFHKPSYTASSGQDDVARFLIAKGLDVDTRNAKQETPLMCAADVDFVPLVSVLLDAGANINATDMYGNIALSRASENGCTATVIELVRRGADGNTALIQAARTGHVATLKLLLETGADLRTSFRGWCALAYASFHGHKDVARTLLDYGICANGCGLQKPLILAAERGEDEIVQLLVERGAKLEARDEGGATALLWATVNKYVKTREILIAAGAPREPWMNLWQRKRFKAPLASPPVFGGE